MVTYGLGLSVDHCSRMVGPQCGSLLSNGLLRSVNNEPLRADGSMAWRRESPSSSNQTLSADGSVFFSVKKKYF